MDNSYAKLWDAICLIKAGNDSRVDTPGYWTNITNERIKMAEQEDIDEAIRLSIQQEEARLALALYESLSPDEQQVMIQMNYESEIMIKMNK